MKCKSCVIKWEGNDGGVTLDYYCNKCLPYFNSCPFGRKTWASISTGFKPIEKSYLNECYFLNNVGAYMYQCDCSVSRRREVYIYPLSLDIPSYIHLPTLSEISFDFGRFTYQSLQTMSLILKQPHFKFSTHELLSKHLNGETLRELYHYQLSEKKEFLKNEIDLLSQCCSSALNFVLLVPLQEIIINYNLGYLTDFYKFLCS